MPSDNREGSSAEDQTRSILWLNYNSEVWNKIQGWSMRRSQIFTNDFVNNTYLPCNEVFTYDPDTDGNQLTIVDCDIRYGSVCDASTFGPFINPEVDPQFQDTIYNNGRVYYFRQADMNDGAGDQYLSLIHI